MVAGFGYSAGLADSGTIFFIRQISISGLYTHPAKAVVASLPRLFSDDLDVESEAVLPELVRFFSAIYQKKLEPL